MIQTYCYLNQNVTNQTDMTMWHAADDVTGQTNGTRT